MTRWLFQSVLLQASAFVLSSALFGCLALLLFPLAFLASPLLGSPLFLVVPIFIGLIGIAPSEALVLVGVITPGITVAHRFCSVVGWYRNREIEKAGKWDETE